MTLNRGDGDAFKDLDSARKFLQQAAGRRFGAYRRPSGFAWVEDSRDVRGARSNRRRRDVLWRRAQDHRSVARRMPVLGGYGGQDRLFVAQGRRLETLLTEMGVDTT